MLQKITAFFTALAMLTSVQMLVPIIGEITYIRGALGVCGFYRLYDTPGEWQARRETVVGHTLDVFQIDLDKAKQVPEGKTGYAPKVAADGVSIDRFYVETIPGYYLCANLYASADPAVNTAPMPLVMLAQGHFSGDRHNSDYQYLAAAFAQRGFLVVSWDMVGRGDDNLLSHYDNYNTVIQTWNSMRLLSYLLSERFTAESTYQINTDYVAVTGASGGGTQAIYMSLLDDRLTASIPAVMVSAYSSGYCQCENGVNALRKRNRLGVTTFKTNNAERVAAFAPKPLLLISCGDDWTMRTPYDEYPYLRYVYSFYGAGSKVENFHDLRGVHDYSLPKRQAALDFLLRQWELPSNGVYDVPYTKDTFIPMAYDQLGTFGASSGPSRPPDASRSVLELYQRIIQEVTA